MNKIDYTKIAKKSLTLLNSKYSDDITVSISSLHAIKHHPEYIKKIKKLSVFKLTKIIIKNLIQIFFIFTLFLKKKKQFKKEKIDVLVISHLTNIDQLNNSQDPYFGMLENFLRDRKIKVKKLLINHIIKNKIKKNKNKILFSRNLNAKFEIQILKKKFFEFFKILKILINSNDRILNKILKRSIISLFESETTFALKFKYELEMFLKIFKPKVIITTFEGYGWERLCFNIAKKKNKKTRCIAYQHTPLNHNNVSAFYKIKKRYQPDLIWCSDKKSFNTLKSKKIKKILYIGNLKYKNEKDYKIKHSSNKKIRTCLVIPEGINDECLKLLQFSINCCKEDKNLKFIWRFHPITKIHKILKSLNFKNVVLNDQIIISKQKKLLRDISRSNFVLYRGSSAVVESVKKGLIPLYLNCDQNINIDPLKEVINKKNYVNTVKDFYLKIKFYESKKFKKVKLIKNFSKLYESKIKKNLALNSLFNEKI